MPTTISHLHGGEEQRIAEGRPDARELGADARSTLQRVGDVRIPQETPIVDVEIGTGKDREQRQRGYDRQRSRRPSGSRLRSKVRRSSDQTNKRRQQHRQRSPEDEGARAGSAGEGDGDQPEIGNEDRQRAERHEAVEQEILGQAPSPRPGGEAGPIDRGRVAMAGASVVVMTPRSAASAEGRACRRSARAAAPPRCR